MSIQWWNGVMNVVTNVDYLAIPIAFIVLRNLREPDVPARVLVSRVLFVVFCGAHHGVMAVVLFSGHQIWLIRTIVNVAMAGVSCWSLLEHIRWARVKAPPVSVQEHTMLEGRVRERTRDLIGTLQELKRAQDEVVRTERLAVLGQLSSSLGHELRNPLGVMSNAVYYLEAISTSPDPRVQKYHDIIRDQIDLSQKIVENLLDFARVKQPSPTVFPLRTVVDEQLARLDLTGIAVRVEEDAGTVAVWADQFQVSQAVFNVLTNACHALEGQSQPRLHVKIGVRDDQATISVRDTGAGMDNETLSRMFEPLYTTKARGIGLGLAITRAFLEVNSGSIHARSTGEEGTEFVITLPMAEAATPAVV
jgi:signal transduction histidine kinase